MDKEQPTAASPESLPSLAALSQTSTDGDDNPHLEYEIPGVLYSMSEEDIEATSWPSPDMASFPAMFDADDCSSGILSTETLDLDLPVEESESVHSFASMATLKSPIGRLSQDESRTADPVLETVDAEDIKINRTCHGALNINPKQLAEVFALFPRKQQPTQAQQPADPPGMRTIELAGITPSAVQPTTAHVDRPMAKDDRPWAGYAANRKLTAELYWKPRAKTLEQECCTLKEIISGDSSKIFQLKTALAAQSAAIASFKDQLAASSKALDILQKEKEVFVENETEYRETIRILKHEVDILTRDGEGVPNRNLTAKDVSSSAKEELHQLRLENQLFAAQIVEYEAELERISQEIESTEYEKLSQPLDKEAHGKDMPNAQTPGTFPVDSVTQKGSDLTSQNPDHKEQVEQAEEEKEECDSVESCPENMSVEVTTRGPQHIFGTVLGMFTLGGNGDENDTEKDEVFVVQEPARSDKATSDEVDCMQWRTPDEDPAYVEVQRIAASNQVENRDPPATVQEETSIEVLQNHDATLEIEVQLSPYPNGDKEHENEAKANPYSGTCDENCGAWSSIFCLFSSDSQE